MPFLGNGVGGSGRSPQPITVHLSLYILFVRNAATKM